MSEGFTDPGVPTRRGRRDPALAQALELETPTDSMADAGEAAVDQPYLLDNDVVLAKVTHTIDCDGQPSWFTYGVQSRVDADESEAEAFVRVATIVNTRALDLAADADTHLREYREAQREAAAARPRRRIVPQ